MNRFAKDSIINNRYRVTGVLGVGGQGAVYRAADLLDGDTERAVKVVEWDDDENGETLARVTGEYTSLLRLSHPNIVKVFEFARLDGRSCMIAMEYVAGESAASRIGLERRPLPLLDTVRILREVALGLQCAHEAHIIHRDLKPANILLLPDGGVKVLDFGLARDMDIGVTITRPNETIGTAPYMSPEQFRRDSKLDARTDIYSLGIVAFELLAGHPPYEASNYQAIAVQHLTERTPRIAPRGSGPPEWYQVFVECCLEKKREHRYQSMAEVIDAIEEGMEDLGMIPRRVKPSRVSRIMNRLFGAA